MDSLACLRPRGLMVSYGNASGVVPPFEIGTLSRMGSLFLTRPTLFHYSATRPELLAMADELFGVVGAGHSFGEPVMFLERPALVDAEAAGDALVLQLPKEAVFAEIERSPRLARRVIASLSQRIESLVHELERQALGSGRARLIDYLVRRAGHHPGPRLVMLPATKAAIASQLNLSPEHFSRLLHELAAAGLLQVEGRRITVHDVERLAGSER